MSPTKALLGLAALLASDLAWAGKHYITGQVIDRNGEPVDRAIVSLAPGNVQLVTDREGRFLIDYLRDEEGKRVRLSKKTEYAFEVFKPGFHTFTLSLFYKKGDVTMDVVTLVEETIAVQDQGENLDPSLYGDKTHSAGANYEGQ